MKRDRKRSASAAWIIGLIVFFLAMGITFSDVYGLDRFEYTRPGYGEGGGPVAPSPALAPMSPSWFSENMGGDNCTSVTMPAVPEPITILLVALGSGMILVGRRK